MIPESSFSPGEQLAPSSSHVISALRTFARFAAAVVLLAGGLSFLLWLVHFARGAAIRPVAGAPPAVAPSAALAFALAAITLILKLQNTDFALQKASRRIRAAASAGAIGVIALGIVDIVLYLLRLDPGSGPPGVFFAIRMAPTTAVLFVATGAGLLLLDAEDRQGNRPAQTLFLVCALFTIAALGVSLFGAFTPSQKAPYASMTWQTALVFLVLSLGALGSRPERGAMRTITVDAAGGIVARRLLPAALLAPLLLCILCYLGYVAKWYEAGFGLAILTTLNSAVLTTLVWRTAGVINLTDAERRKHLAEIEELNSRLRRSMAETHHRVRNNLQIISALADMQIMEGRETVPVAEVRRIESQVQALAAVHDLLTQEARTDAGAEMLWADDILKRLADLLGQAAKGRTIAVHADRARITGRQASAMVVVANELIVNALKNSDADVEVLFRIVSGEARLTVLDRGVGFPEGFNPVKDASTGLELVHQMSGWDLHGEVQFTNRPEGGGCVILRMPLARA